MMSNSSFQESQEEDIYDRDELTGLSGKNPFKNIFQYFNF